MQTNQTAYHFRLDDEEGINMITSKDAIQRKQRIRDAAFQLFKNNGVDKVTYCNISHFSGISETSLYHYYPKKAYLLLDTYKDLWEEILAELKSATLESELYQHACGYQQIELLIDAFEHVYFEHSEYLKFALECKLYWNRQSVTIDPEEYDAIVAPIIEQFTLAIQKGAEDQSIRLQTDLHVCSFLLWSILRTYTEQVILHDDLYLGENRFRMHFHSLRKFLLSSFR